ncbi:hypothetical protein [Kitasatospora sp. NPDC004272]
MTVRARKTALRIAALGAAALVLTACNDDGASSDPGLSGASAPHSTAASPTAHASPTGKAKPKDPERGSKSSPAAGGAAAGGDKAAQAKLSKLVLNPEDAGAGYVSNGDDSTDLDDYPMDGSCFAKKDGTIDGLTAYVQRYLREDHESHSMFLSTSAGQYATVATAHKDIQTARTDSQRCPTYSTDDGSKFTGVHAVQAPAVPGAEEVYAEEGKVTFAPDDQGSYAPAPYTYYLARKGTVEITVFVAGDPTWNPQMAKDDAKSALATMATRW